jgi:polyisoprenoid-binding protein YceI
MKTISLTKQLSLAFAVAGLVVGARAADGMVKYTSQPGSTVKMEGTSTVHDWATIGTVIGGSMELDAAFDADLKTVKQSPKVEVVIPVRSLKSQVTPGGPRMDQVMQEHMNMKQFPRIEYKLAELTSKDGKLEAKGALTVSGVTKTVTMPVTFTRVDGGKIKVTGSTTVKMTEYSIKPPNPEFAGVGIKTGDDVKITFEWLTAKAQ